MYQRYSYCWHLQAVAATTIAGQEVATAHPEGTEVVTADLLVEVTEADTVEEDMIALLPVVRLDLVTGSPLLAFPRAALGRYVTLSPLSLTVPFPLPHIRSQQKSRVCRYLNIRARRDEAHKLNASIPDGRL